LILLHVSNPPASNFAFSTAISGDLLFDSYSPLRITLPFLANSAAATNRLERSYGVFRAQARNSRNGSCAALTRSDTSQFGEVLDCEAVPRYCPEIWGHVFHLDNAAIHVAMDFAKN